MMHRDLVFMSIWLVGTAITYLGLTFFEVRTNDRVERGLLSLVWPVIIPILLVRGAAEMLPTISQVKGMLSEKKDFKPKVSEDLWMEEFERQRRGS